MISRSIKLRRISVQAFSTISVIHTKTLSVVLSLEPTQYFC